MSPRGKHSPNSPSSFYLSLGRHIAGAVAIVAVVALVIALATRDDTGATLGGVLSPTPSETGTATATPSASPSASPTTTTRAPRERNQITVAVLNGTTRSGLASQTAERIVQAGFDVPVVDNGSGRDKTVILYRKGFKPEAMLLLEDFPDLVRVKSAASNPDVSGETMLTVILGDDYRV